ncbi:MAG: flagellar biosynthetic protein FliR [Lachnospiraceae bacterium]
MIDYSFPIEELEYFLLILVRVSTFIFSAPFFSLNNVPRRVRAALSLFVAFLLYSSISPHVYPQYSTLLEYAILVLKEAIAGLLIGLSAQFCLLIVNFAGQLIDVEIGFSMAQTMDPATRQQTTLSSFYYQYAVMLMMLLSGTYQFLLQALAETFQLIPVGRVDFILYDMYEGFLAFLANYMIIGFRICLPVFCTTLLLNGILGVMAKVSPQMNMFAIGMQLKVFVGLGVLFLTTGMLPSVANVIFEQMKVTMVTFVKAMGGG